MQTIKFFKMLDTLSKMSEGKFIPFGSLTPENIRESDRNVFYDEKSSADKYEVGYKIPLDFLVDDNHHDIISYFEGYARTDFEYTVRVKFDEDENPYIEVAAQGEYIIIEDGDWDFA